MSVAAAIRRKHVAHVVNGWRLLRSQPRFKVLFILVFATACEIGLWKLFADGFDFLERFGGVAGMIMARLFSLFYMGMFMMLVMSGIVTSYATLFRSDEMAYLLVRPLPVKLVVVYKFFESAYLSSWAFLFIILPFVGAYAVHLHLGFRFGLWTAVFSLPFLVICSGLGTIVIQCVVRWWPRRVGHKPLLLAAGTALGLGLWLAKDKVEAGEGTRFALSALIPGMRLSGNMLMPSAWTADGIQAFTRGEWARGSLLLAVVVTTAAVLTLVVEGLGRATFQTAWESVSEGGGRRGRPAAIFAWGDRVLGFLPGDVRAMIMKDVRTFFRDAMQWSQVLIFFGLLGMYFANLRTFHYDTYSPTWRNMVCFLNVFSVSAVLCSLGARFIYPQLSLEGQGFWLLGLAPTNMRRILLSKFALAIVCTGVVSVFLIGLSSSMLKVGGVQVVVSVALVGCVVLAVCGLSTGLGAIFMDLRQRNPAAIVGGFGGTVNLVLSLGYMLAAIVPFGLAFHLRAADLIDETFLHRSLGFSAAWCLLLTAAATAAPLVLGVRALRDRDY
ncbi:MAG: hypothetical protein K8T26_16905 [Lentisphaerae bacterium]|nr:hypothetical protein [Lentisphaerota bacterium]